MARVPDRFSDDFTQKGDSFFELAELLYTSPDRYYTLDELADKIDRSKARVSQHTSPMVDAGWLDRQEDQTTFSWNTDAHNPSSTEGITAILRFYGDCLKLVRKHSETNPGTYAIIGLVFFLASLIVFVFFIGFLMGVTGDSNIPAGSVLALAIGIFLSGIIATLMSPLWAWVHRLMGRIIPENLSREE